MKANSHVLRAVFAIVLFATTVLLFADTPRVTPQRSMVVGVWSGFSTDNHYFVRLELDEKGMGYAALIFNHGTSPTQVYRVVKWELSGWDLKLDVKAVSHPAEPMRFQRVRCEYTYMECEFTGKDWRGMRKAILLADRDLRAFGDRAQKAIAKEKK